MLRLLGGGLLGEVSFSLLISSSSSSLSSSFFALAFLFFGAGAAPPSSLAAAAFLALPFFAGPESPSSSGTEAHCLL